MATPSTRQELIDYCLRQLGAPVLEINVDEDQLDDRIDEALQYYQTFHGDATMRTYVKHQVTDADIANKYIALPDEVVYVKRVLPFSSYNTISGGGMFSVRYQMALNDIYNMRTGTEMLSYEMSLQYLNTMDILLNGTPTMRWARHTSKLYIDADWGQSELLKDQWIVVECFVALDPEDFAKIYNDLWLKRYATALIKKNWGQNLVKFEGIEMPGGVTLNGQKILDAADADVEKLEEEIRTTYELPVDFEVG